MEKCVIRNQPCGSGDIEEDLCFISIASSEELKSLETIIVESLKRHSIREYIAEDRDKLNKEMFCEKICSQIIKSRFCIMVLTEAKPRHKNVREPNPNVYFEYGLATAIKKSVLPLFPEDANKAPFNIRGLNLIEYSLDEASEKYIGKILDKHIKTAIEETAEIIESQRKFKNEENWCRNEGGKVFNILIHLKSGELFLRERNNGKYAVYERHRLLAWLESFAKTIFRLLMEDVFEETIPIRDDLINIGKNLDKLGKFSLTSPHEEFDELADKTLVQIDSLISSNRENFKIIETHLHTFSGHLAEVKKKFKTMKLRWGEIDGDEFIVRNSHEISSSCQNFAEDLNLLGANVMHELPESNRNEIKAIVSGFMNLYLRDNIGDGGISLSRFRDSYRDLMERCEKLLAKLN